MLVLGVDPGYAFCGWALVEIGKWPFATRVESGVIETSKNATDQHRIQIVAQEVHNLLATFEPDALAIESWNYQGNRSHSRNDANIPQVIGSIEGRAAARGNHVVMITASGVKASLGVRGKDGIVRTLEGLGYTVTSKAKAKAAHEWDALAVAIVGAQRVRVEGGRRG